MKWIVGLIIIAVLGAGAYLLLSNTTGYKTSTFSLKTSGISPTEVQSTQSMQTSSNSFPLAISAMQTKSYPGSSISIVRSMSDGANYKVYVTSYQSDGLTIYSLLTIPTIPKPAGGYPVIILNHGYIQPTEYSTTQSYQSMVIPLAESGYVVFMPDYRGNGNSEGKPTQVYVSPDYVTDSLNAVTSIKKLSDPSSPKSSSIIVNPNRIGMLGHSMGGNITLHVLVLSKYIKAAVILSGVVGSYSDILDWWNKRVATGVLTTANDQQTAVLVQNFVKQHGTPQTNPDFWNSIDPTFFVQNISAPVQIQVGTADTTVPPSFSSSFNQKLKASRKSIQFFSYPGADHNLSPDQTQVFQRSIAFFDKYLK